MDTTQKLMDRSSHPFYEKFRRAQAGLPPLAPKPKPLEPEELKQNVVKMEESGLGPSWSKQEHAAPKTQVPAARSHGPVPRKYASRADQIRAEWKPTPRYPTYDDYLAEKNRRRAEESGLTPDQIAMRGPSTHAWDPPSRSGGGRPGGQRRSNGRGRGGYGSFHPSRY